jgi:hypothetical protein
MQKRLRSEQVKLDDEHGKAGKHAEVAAQQAGEAGRRAGAAGQHVEEAAQREGAAGRRAGKAGQHAEEAAQRAGELKRLGMKLTVSRRFLAASR